MNDTETRALVEAALLTIVPDAPLDSIGDDTDLRDALELDSLDFLSFVEQLGHRSGQRVDEDDYPHLRTLAGCTRFLQARATV